MHLTHIWHPSHGCLDLMSTRVTIHYHRPETDLGSVVHLCILTMGENIFGLYLPRATIEIFSGLEISSFTRIERSEAVSIE